MKTADGGILFLDEIGELSLELQAQLLKAIEEKSYLPMGADQEIRSDFQLICATNKILPENISQGLFRQDLYARINLWEFHLPSLTERLEDIEPNIEYEIRRLRKEKGLLADFTPEAKKAYLDFATSEEALWTDNFRSLTASMERMVTYSSYGSITLEIVLQEIELLKKNWSKRTPPFQHAAAAFQTAEKPNAFPCKTNWQPCKKPSMQTSGIYLTQFSLRKFSAFAETRKPAPKRDGNFFPLPDKRKKAMTIQQG